MKRFRVTFFTSRNTRIDHNTSTDGKKVFMCEVTTAHTIYVWAADAGKALEIANKLDYVKALANVDQIRVEAVT